MNNKLMRKIIGYGIGAGAAVIGILADRILDGKVDIGAKTTTTTPTTDEEAKDENIEKIDEKDVKVEDDNK